MKSFSISQLAAPFQSVRWRTVILTLLALFLIHLAFFDTTLHDAFDTHVAPKLSNTKQYEPFIPSSIPSWESGDTSETVAICLAVKDQYPDMAEWLVHHYAHLGIRRFYIMDDGSSPPLATLDYSKFIDPRALTHRYYLPETRGRYQQLTIYDECQALFGKHHKWIAYFDADEFLEVQKPHTLNSILEPLEKNETVGALAINWVIHGWDNKEKRPAEGVRKGFTSCMLDTKKDLGFDQGTRNQHIKVIVKTDSFLQPSNPHKMFLQEGKITVGEDGDVVDRRAWRVPPSRKKIGLHHYAIKSKEEYAKKIDRGNGMGDPKGWAWFEEMMTVPSATCLSMAVYEP